MQIKRFIPLFLLLATACVKIENIYSPGEDGVYGRGGWKLQNVVGGYVSVNASAVNGTNLFIATSAGMRIYSVADPLNPIYVTTYKPEDCSFEKIEIDNNTAYLADTGNGRLDMVSLSNPANPVSVGTAAFSGSITEIESDGNYAYCADSALIWIADISDPAHPVAVNYPVPGSAVTIGGIEATNDYVFLATSSGLRILTNAEPELAGYLRTVGGTGNQTDIAVSGDYAYLTAVNDYLYIVDISDPATAALSGSVLLDGTLQSIAVADSYAYIAAGTNGVHIVNVANPAGPSLVTTVVSTNNSGFVFDAKHVAIAGNYAYVSGGTSGRQVVDISTPSQPEIVAEVSYGSSGAGDLAVNGSYVYACGTDGLAVFNVSDPKTAALTGALNITGTCTSVETANGFAFVTASSGFYTVDVHDPAHPVRLYGAGLTGNPVDVTVTEAAVNSTTNLYAFVASEQFGVRVFRVTDPSNTAAVYSVTTALDSASLSIDQATAFGSDVLYVADYDAGIKVLDWPGIYNGETEAEYLITNLMTYGWVNDVELYGNILFAGTTAGLERVDVGDRSNFVLLPVLDDLPEITKITISGEKAYLCSENGVTVVNITDPLNPKIKQTVGVQGAAVDVGIEGDYAYVGADGIYIYQY